MLHFICAERIVGNDFLNKPVGNTPHGLIIKLIGLFLELFIEWVFGKTVFIILSPFVRPLPGNVIDFSQTPTLKSGVWACIEKTDSEIESFG